MTFIMSVKFLVIFFFFSFFIHYSYNNIIIQVKDVIFLKASYFNLSTVKCLILVGLYFRDLLIECKFEPTRNVHVLLNDIQARSQSLKSTETNITEKGQILFPLSESCLRGA